MFDSTAEKRPKLRQLVKTHSPSISKVAEVAGVSLGTVSRIMNGEKSVNPDLRKQVLSVARTLGFVPRIQTPRLAIVVGRRNPRLPVGYTYALVSLLTDCCHQVELRVETLDAAQLEAALDCSVMAAVGVVFDDSMLQLRGVPHLPLFSINRPLAHAGIHSIYTDHYEQGLVATEHLLAFGHRKIAFYGGVKGEWGTMQRFEGYRKAMRSAGVAPHPEWVSFAENGTPRDVLSRFLEAGITALLNFNDDVIAETLHTLSNVLHQRIGRDVSVISLEDIPLYQYFSPPQTVIRQPLEQMAAQVVNTVVDIVKDNNWDIPPMDECLHAELIPRHSVGAVPHW